MPLDRMSLWTDKSFNAVMTHQLPHAKKAHAHTKQMYYKSSTVEVLTLTHKKQKKI